MYLYESRQVFHDLARIRSLKSFLFIIREVKDEKFILRYSFFSASAVGGVFTNSGK